MNYEVRLLPKDFTLEALDEEINKAISIGGETDLTLLLNIEQFLVFLRVVGNSATLFYYPLDFC